MERSPFRAALAALFAPLEFVERSDEAALARVRDLTQSVKRAGEKLDALAIPRDAKDSIAEALGAFTEAAGQGRAREAAVAALAALRPLAAPEWSEAALARPLTALPGVGPKRAKRLAERGLSTLGDLLFHLPNRYDDRRQLSVIAALDVGCRASFEAQILSTGFSGRPQRGRRGGGRTLHAAAADATGSITLKWFRGGESIAPKLTVGSRWLVTGDVTRYRFDKEIVHPELEFLGAPEPAEAAAAEEPVVSEESVGAAPPPEASRARSRGERSAPGATSSAPARGIVPDYPTPEGLNPRFVRELVARAVGTAADLVPGWLPSERRSLAPADALRTLHAPPADVDVEALRRRDHPARVRLVLEELYLLELGLLLRRNGRRGGGLALANAREAARAAAGKLPFRLTRAQQRALGEIGADLERTQPMNRLLEGDVGSGKTAVAYLAAAAAAAAGAQSALMAPTELLAEQHMRTLEKLTERVAPAERLRVGLLTSSVPRAEAQRLRAALVEGSLDLVVGTHALVQESVAFRRLALVITDEQHRFGVRQRAALQRKASESEAGAQPHTLVMTATPIPRTLALTLHGDLDLSVLDELPPGRQPVETLLLRAGEGQRVARMLREAAERGEQVFVVYPLVEESEKIDLRSAEEGAERIRRAYPDLEVELVHGRQEAAERAVAMQRFERGEAQVLVATTVIEVGVDVPNATLMIIEHAERFGLAQLHQLRGRIGRGAKPASCVLVARGRTSDSEARLAALLETRDGFAIAEADLRIRGPGEFLGSRQHGRLLDLRLADLLLDGRALVRARELAERTLASDPGLAREPELLRALRQRWGERLALAEVG
jgi:ATP-dependent DNA helicase RecG